MRNLLKLWIVLIIFCMFFLVGCNVKNNYIILSSGIEISENPINNDYANYYNGGQICQIKDKIYYNFNTTNGSDEGLNYNLVELSSEKVQQIEQGFYCKSEYYDELYMKDSMYKNGDSIYRRNKNCKLQKWNENEKCFQDIGLSENVSWMYFVKNDVVYYIPQKLFTSSNTYDLVYNNWKKFEGGKVSNAFTDEDATVVAVDENQIYYLDSTKSYIYCYDIKNKTESTFKKNFLPSDWNPAYPDYIFVMGDYWITYTDKYENNYDSQICMYNLKEEIPSKNILFQESYGLSNVYNGKLYISDFGNGELISYDLESREITTLYDYPIYKCYILDDEWVYFGDGEARLFRVPQDGSSKAQLILNLEERY